MSETSKSKAPQRRYRPATPASLERAALHYLARYATSAENLRRVLQRRVEKSARFCGTDRQEGGAQIEAILAKLTAVRLIDDAAYARSRATTLFHRGLPRRSIKAMLHAKGVAGSHIDQALAAVEAEIGDPDLAAALAYARRRRIGPYRSESQRMQCRQRDLAALSRRGFDFDTVRRVIEAKDPDTLEAEAAATDR